MLSSYIKTHKKTHIIFDLDETIVELILPWERCLEFIAEDLQILDPTLINGFNAQTMSWAQMQNEYVRKFGEKARKLIVGNNLRFETELLKGLEKHNEIIDFIENTDNLNFYIWSSNTLPVINHVLEELKIKRKIKNIASRTDLKYLKPDIEGFEKIYDPKVSKSKYLMVGDSKYDRMAADNAGIDFYYVDYFKPQFSS